MKEMNWTQPPNNPFDDQIRFMGSCGQKIDADDKQYEMYAGLVREEFKEYVNAFKGEDKAEQLDALVDLIVVSIGAIVSMGVDPQDAWDEVMDSNFAKIDPATKKVVRRLDGKILKPEGWKPPNMKRFFTNGE